MKCPNCKQELLNSDLFCFRCGTRVKNAMDFQRNDRGSGYTAKPLYIPDPMNSGPANHATPPILGLHEDLRMAKSNGFCMSGAEDCQENRNFRPHRNSGMGAAENKDRGICHVPLRDSPDQPYQYCEEKDEREQQKQQHGISFSKTQKSKKIWHFLLLVFCVLITAAGLAFFIRNYQGHWSEDEAVEINQTYFILNSVPISSSPFTREGNNRAVIGQKELIICSLENEDEEIWGKLQNGKWILMADKNYIYLVLEESINITTDQEDMVVIVRKKMDVYTLPTRISQPVASISTGCEIYVYESVTEGSEKWGRIGNYQWICLSDANGVYFLTTSS